jgi:hypothetical protein
MLKFLAFTVVLGLLVAGSAAFVSSHPRSLMACSSSCEQYPPSGGLLTSRSLR